MNMKAPIFGALALLLSCNLASAQSAPAPVKTEAQLLFDGCRAAYAGLKSFRGTVKTDDESIVNGAKFSYSGSARVTFERPDSLRIDGHLAGGAGDYSILGVPGNAWYRMPFQNGGKWQKVEDLDMAVASMAGVAAGAPTGISALLMPSVGVDPFGAAKDTRVEGEERIDGKLCTKIVGRSKADTTRWWIDKKTRLLRRIVTSYDEKQSAAIMAQTQRSIDEDARRNGRPVHKFEMRLISNTADFSVDALNGEVDQSLFDTSDSIWPWRQG